jgi:transposase
MRFVPDKTDDQLDLQALHRVRDRLVSRRTSVINQLRALLLERGVTFRSGPYIFCDDLLQDMAIEAQIGDQALQLEFSSRSCRSSRSSLSPSPAYFFFRR